MAELYEDRLAAEPLKFRLPCPGCRWLTKQDDDSYRCAFPLHEIVVPYGCEVRPHVGHARDGVTFTRKMIDGPIADDARLIECAMRPTTQPNGETG